MERTCTVASHELLMEMKVATLYCFVGGNSIQTGTADDSEATEASSFEFLILNIVIL